MESIEAALSIFWVVVMLVGGKSYCTMRDIFAGMVEGLHFVILPYRRSKLFLDIAYTKPLAIRTQSLNLFLL
jgi:hypothetical protein